jgi:hypothetical protein
VSGKLGVGDRAAALSSFRPKLSMLDSVGRLSTPQAAAKNSK